MKYYFFFLKWVLTPIISVFCVFLFAGFDLYFLHPDLAPVVERAVQEGDAALLEQAQAEILEQSTFGKFGFWGVGTVVVVLAWFVLYRLISFVEPRSKTSAIYWVITLPYALFGALLLVFLAMVVFFLVTEQDFDKGLAAYRAGDYETALEEWRPLAEQGHAPGQYNLGLMYLNGEGVPQDYGKAMRWFRLAGEQGHPKAQYDLGIMYFKGEGVAPDLAEAVRWYRLAAEQGHAKAQLNMAAAYYNGWGVPQHYGAAMRWNRLAAEQGLAAAQFSVGGMYFQGRGVPEDNAEAVRWFRLAAKQGFAKSQNYLGDMYRRELGVPQDFVTARMWYLIAVEQGSKNAVDGLNLTEWMKPEQKAEAERRAKLCMESNYKDCD